MSVGWSRSGLRALAFSALALAGCSTPKIAASEALAPELVVRALPAGAQVVRDNQVIGHTPLTLTLHGGEGLIALEVSHAGYFPTKVQLDGAAIYHSGGGESWVALKAENMGADTADLDAGRPADLDRGGHALYRAKRCPEALPFFDRAIALDRRYPKAHKDRALCLIRLHRRDEATTELETYLFLQPDAPDAARVQAAIVKARASRDIDLGKGDDEDTP